MDQNGLVYHQNVKIELGSFNAQVASLMSHGAAEDEDEFGPEGTRFVNIAGLGASLDLKHLNALAQIVGKMRICKDKQTYNIYIYIQ